MYLLAACAALCQTSYPYVITTVAGTYPLGDGGPATAALLLGPAAVALDRAGNLYIADYSNGRVRKVSPAGTITTVPGTENTYAQSLALDAAGSLYVAGYYNVWKIEPAGKLTTVAGSGNYGFGGDDRPATEATFAGIAGVALDGAGNIYISDGWNHRVRKVNTAGIITTIAGNGTQGYIGDNIPAKDARLYYPGALAVDAAGNLYIADTYNYRVRKVTAAGIITTVVGTGGYGNGGDGGLATAAQLGSVGGLAFDGQGNLYLSDVSNHRVRKVTPAGIITAVGGNAQYGFGGDGALATSAMLANPAGIALDAAGNLYIADSKNNRVRKVTAGGIISTVAGATHFSGDGEAATGALLQYHNDVALDGSGNLYVADRGNHRIRKVAPSGVISTVAGNGTYTYSGDNGLATAAGFSYPACIAVDGEGNLYVTDSGRIRKVSLSGVITTVAGTGIYGYNGDNRPAISAYLYGPQGIAVDPAGNLFIADYSNHRVRRVAPDGTITTYAGTGERGFGGDGGLATAALLNYPWAVAVDGAGNLYIADRGNYLVRKVTRAGIISTVAGNRQCCSGGDGSPATSARVNPYGVAVDASGSLYIATYSTVRKVSADGIISTIAGTGRSGYSGDGGIATSAELGAYGLAVDRSGNVYLADYANHRIRKLTPNAPAKLEIVSGDGQRGPVGAALAGALIVRVSGAAGPGVPGVTVAFAVASGAATLSAPSTSTDTNGRAGVGVTLGNTAGTVVVTATATGLLPVRFTLTATEAAPVVVGPRIAAGGVAGVGGSIPPVKQISPNGLVSIYGESFAAAGTARAVAAGDLVGGRVPTKFAGVCVEVAGQRSPVLAVYPNQLNIQVPTLSASGEASVQVILNCGETGEVRSNLEKVTLQAATPEFLYFVLNADGKNPIAAVNAVTGEYIGATFVPAKPGDVLTLYATGFGLTNPAYQAGELAGGIAPVVGPVKVSVGGVELGAGDLLYAGVSPGLAGVYQVNLRLPGDLPDGDLSVVVRVGSFSSPPGGYITVRR